MTRGNSEFIVRIRAASPYPGKSLGMTNFSQAFQRLWPTLQEVDVQFLGDEKLRRGFQAYLRAEEFSVQCVLPKAAKMRDQREYVANDARWTRLESCDT